MQRFYPIGIPGQPWTREDAARWFESRRVQRSFRDEVRARLEAIDASAFEVFQYGALSIEPERYPLLAARSRVIADGAPWALVTGGVHGYETSGVQGALDFLDGAAERYLGQLNLLVAPCVSPWGYEVINRWNPAVLDPNRAFGPDGVAEESLALRALVNEPWRDFVVHIDLHETTDSDESEFRPALAARDGELFEPGHIPDGFYTVGDSENPQPEFQAAIVAAVQPIAPIAPPDERGQIIGADVTQRGVIHYPYRALGLCAGVTDARLTTTTEVYPDSPQITDAICNAAQVAAVTAALDFALLHIRL